MRLLIVFLLISFSVTACGKKAPLRPPQDPRSTKTETDDTGNEETQTTPAEDDYDLYKPLEDPNFD